MSAYTTVLKEILIKNRANNNKSLNKSLNKAKEGMTTHFKREIQDFGLG